MIRYLKQYKFLLFLTVLFTAISSLSYVFIAILLQQVMDIVDMGDMDSFIRILFSPRFLYNTNFAISLYILNYPSFFICLYKQAFALFYPARFSQAFSLLLFSFMRLDCRLCCRFRGFSLQPSSDEA